MWDAMLQALKFTADARPDPSRSQGTTDNRQLGGQCQLQPSGKQRPPDPFRQNEMCAGLKGQEVR